MGEEIKREALRVVVVPGWRGLACVVDGTTVYVADRGSQEKTRQLAVNALRMAYEVTEFPQL